MSELTLKDINMIIDIICEGMYKIETADIYDGVFYKAESDGLIQEAVETVSYDGAKIGNDHDTKEQLLEALRQVLCNVAHRVIHVYYNYDFDSRDEEIEQFICQFLSMESLFWVNSHWREYPISNIRSKFATDEDIKEIFKTSDSSKELWHMHRLYKCEQDLPALLSYREYIQAKSILDKNRYLDAYPESRCIRHLCLMFS